VAGLGAGPAAAEVALAVAGLGPAAAAVAGLGPAAAEESGAGEAEAEALAAVAAAARALAAARAAAGGGEVVVGRGEAAAWQGLTLLHFSAQPKPFLTQNTPYTAPITPHDLINTSQTPPKLALDATPNPQKALTLS